MIKEGSFVEIDYVGRVEGTNEIFDLTSEEVAKKEGIYNPKQKYGPVLVIIGANMIIPGVEEQLKNMKPGEEKEFVVEPKKAFGERNSKLVKVISLMEFKKEKIDPVPGMFITIDGLQAKVQSVSGGRVRVDFNHPLAGKHLRYKVRLIREITNTQDKISAVLKHYGLDVRFKLKDNVLIFETKKDMNDVTKKFIEDLIKKWIKDIKEIKFEKAKDEKKENKN